MKRHLTILITALTMLSCSQDIEQQKMDIAGRLQNINELQLEEFTLSKTYTVRDKYFDNQEKGYTNIFEAFGDWLEHKTRVGARIGIYSVRRNYSAYIDLNELSNDDITLEENRLEVVLPEIKVKVLGNDLVPEAIHERVTGFRWQITESERNAMKMHAAQQLDSTMNSESDPMVNDMKLRAKKKARAWISSIVDDMGYSVKIKFKE